MPFHTIPHCSGTGQVFQAFHSVPPLRSTVEHLPLLQMQLDLPRTYRFGASHYIEVRRNALPFRTQEPHEGSELTPPPFHADPHVRLVVFCIRAVTESGLLKRN